MHFIDKVQVALKAGKGGDGRVGFKREKFISKGGPNGGDGGDGGDIILVASRNQDTLAQFRYQKELIAEPGEPGGKSRKHGKSAPNLLVAVPVGTMATDEQGKIVADLTQDGQQTIVAKGGRGGFGNAHFVSSTRQAPKFAEKGEPGEQINLTLEIKMIADVGLVGLPNAGKSTLLSKLSNARPEIADYPFTTITPNLGVVDIDKDTTVLIADIPGLIEGAAEGKGLGHDFLRHIERTAVILHLIDAYHENVAKAYATVKRELQAYEPQLIKRPEVIALNKIEGLDKEIIADLLSQLQQAVSKNTPVLAISAHSGEGLKDLLYAIKKITTKVRAKVEKESRQPTIPVITLDDKSGKWQVVKEGDIFLVSGPRIEKFAARTDFNNQESIQRLRDIMKKMGIMHGLERQGIQPGQGIKIAKQGQVDY